MILAFSAPTFNNLYHEEDLPEMAPAPFLSDFGGVFVKHGKQESLSLEAVHNHNEVDGDERMVAFAGEGSVIIKKVSEAAAADHGAIPYLFLPVEDSDATSAGYAPLVYAVPKDGTHRDQLEKEAEALCDEAFLREFIDIAKKNKTNGLMFGLSLNSRHFLGAAGGVPFKTLETEGPVPGTLEVKPVDHDNEAGWNDGKKATWSFDADGKPVTNSACLVG